MDPGVRSPLIDFFRRGEVTADVRLQAAQGSFAPRAHEQLALLLILADDPDPAIAGTAARTLDALPAAALARFLGRQDAPQLMRDFFAARGIQPDMAAGAGEVDDLPLVQTGPEPSAGGDATEADPRVLSTLPVIDRMKLAMRGTREQRSQLIRDSNRLVAVAVLSSPKLNESEVEGFARMANLSEDVLRIIAMNRTWLKNYNVVAALTRNPKTPTGLAMGFLQRLNEKDLKTLSMDRNVAEPVRLAARKFLVKGRH
ncbi:MAG TPA: hypothetical protein VJ813_12680 [Vicinamibacterales bacterium]|nr:hypothetical protein [Vicinamibacterales bacterium]